MIEVHNIVILERPLQGALGGLLPDGMQYAEWGAGQADVVSKLGRTHGRTSDPARIRRRFDHGFRFFAIVEGGLPVAWFWVVVGGERYLDELRWRIPLAADQAWGRDAFVVPSHRGRRLLRALMQAAIVVEQRSLQIFSDVDAGNVPSLRAHVALGFRRIGTARAVAVGGRWLARAAPPAAMPVPIGLRAGRRLVWLSQDDGAWHDAHVA